MGDTSFQAPGPHAAVSQKGELENVRGLEIVKRVLGTYQYIGGTYHRAKPRCSGRGLPKMLSCACWMPGNRPSRALAPAVTASLRKPRFDRLPTTSTLPNYNNWSRSAVSRAVSLEGSTTAPRRRLWTDTTITHHLGNVKHRYLSQEPARLQQEHAADGDNPSEIAAAAAMAAAAEESGGIGRGGTDSRQPR